MIAAVHNYKVRPGYGSKELLIEFHPAGPDKVFWPALLSLLQRSGAAMVGDEDSMFLLTYRFACVSGRFEVCLDEWGSWWVHFEDQACVEFVDRILSDSDQFEKLQVDFDQYASPPSSGERDT